LHATVLRPPALAAGQINRRKINWSEMSWDAVSHVRREVTPQKRRLEMQTATATAATVNTIGLSDDESKRATADKQKKERQDKMDQLSADATYVCSVLVEFTGLTVAAEKAEAARLVFFETRMSVPEFRDAIHRLFDWGGTKKNSDRLVVDGKSYKSVKAIFREKFGVSYDTVRRVCGDIKHIANLMSQDDDIAAAEAARIEAEASGTDWQKPSVSTPPTAPVTKPPTPHQSKPSVPTEEEILSVNGHAPLINIIRDILQFIAERTGPLTTEEKSTVHGNLIDELQNELDEADGE
jgi:hypothetical protein